MALADLMSLYKEKSFGRKVGISEERIKDNLPIIRQYISF